MCGRFTQAYTWQELHALYSLSGSPQNLKPRYNIAPTQRIDFIRTEDADVLLARARWGLIPGWWKKSAKEVPTSFNARAETIAEKPFFRAAFKRRRCIIPASGFYEWVRKGEVKQPWYVSMADGSPMLFAGIWETWTEPETREEIISCSIATTSPNDFMMPIHNRMPVVLSPEGSEAWMSEQDHALLKPCPSEWLRAWPVSTRVNNAAKHDDPELISALDASANSKV